MKKIAFAVVSILVGIAGGCYFFWLGMMLSREYNVDFGLILPAYSCIFGLILGVCCHAFLQDWQAYCFIPFLCGAGFILRLLRPRKRPRI